MNPTFPVLLMVVKVRLATSTRAWSSHSGGCPEEAFLALSRFFGYVSRGSSLWQGRAVSRFKNAIRAMLFIVTY